MKAIYGLTALEKDYRGFITADILIYPYQMKPELFNVTKELYRKIKKR